MGHVRITAYHVFHYHWRALHFNWKESLVFEVLALFVCVLRRLNEEARP